MTETESRQEGGCLCGDIRYEVNGSPMIVHACHCTRCQKRLGTAFAVNFWIESDRVQITSGNPEKSGAVDSEEGGSSEVWACGKCGSGLWTIYRAAGGNSLFVRAGTLDDPSAFPPDVHIYTSTKHSWVQIPDDVPSYEGYYNFRDVWPEKSQQRFRALREVS